MKRMRYWLEDVWLVWSSGCQWCTPTLAPRVVPPMPPITVAAPTNRPAVVTSVPRYRSINTWDTGDERRIRLG